MGALTEKFLEALGRELGFTPRAEEGGLVPLQLGERRALLHFREGEEALVLYAEIGRPLESRRMESLAHFMARNLLLSETGAAVFSYIHHDNMIGVNMRLNLNALDAAGFLQSLDAFLGMAEENAKLLAGMNESAGKSASGPAAADAPPAGKQESFLRV